MKRSNALLPSEWKSFIQSIQIIGVDNKRNDEILNLDKEIAISNVGTSTKSKCLCQAKRIERLSID
jgi:hypothetical protein